MCPSKIFVVIVIRKGGAELSRAELKVVLGLMSKNEDCYSISVGSVFDGLKGKP